VTTPTLVIHGDSEAPPVKQQGEAIASEVEDGSRFTFANAGHLVNQDRPQAFNEATDAFLNRIGG